MLSVLGIMLSLLLLMVLAYRDVSVIVLAPICALLAVLLDGNLPVLAVYTQIFMSSVGNFIRDYFPLFLLGAIFGKLMEDSGAAAKISDVIVSAVGKERTILAIVLSCAILTYGGVSLFVVVFAAFPLARSLFRQVDLPRRFIPATIGLGSFTFTMTALPGSPQIQNLIPMSYFRTNAFAAPGLGCIAGLVMFGLGMLWLNSRAARARRNAEGFGPLLPMDENAADNSTAGQIQQLPSAWSAFTPIVCVIGLNFVFSQFIIPGWDTDYLATETFGKTDINKVRGPWATILSMSVTLLITIALHFRSFEKLKSSLAHGARSSLMPVFNTASEVGYGATIKALAGFAIVQKFVTGIAPGNPLISEAIAVNALAAITGSASGGLSIALNTLGETYYQRGLAAGIDPQLLHRIASMSCGGLDSLPHNGALITLLLICGVTHRQGYLDVAVVTIACPLIAIVTVLVLGTQFGSF
jgi:H+/gluconate symporter-like permease